MAEPRWPGDVTDVSFGVDTDGDGCPDTTITTDGVDLVLHTDLDGDRYADRVLRIGPDAVAREVGYRPAEPTGHLLDPALPPPG